MIRNSSSEASGSVARRHAQPDAGLRRAVRHGRMRAVKVGGIVRRGRAWASTAKSAVLFLAPLPLAVATLAALINDDLAQALLAGGALTCIWAAGALAFQGLAAEARYSLNQQETLPRLRLKLLSALLTGAGVGMAALAGHSPVSVALIFVLLAIAGHVAFFGADLRPRRIRVADAEGVDRAEVEELLVQASRRLRGLEIAAESIPVPDVRRRLASVLSTGNAILQELERRPSEASRVRRFLNVYLDGAERVTSEYARAAVSPGRSAPDREYQALLGDLERAFTAQHHRLVERDRVALDVDIEVLTARLRQEVPAEGENRS